MPTKVVFGDGVSKDLAQQVPLYGQHPLLVTDPVLAELAFVRELLSGLASVPLFTGVESNPKVSNVDALASVIRDNDHDLVIAIGGGSRQSCLVGSFLVGFDASTEVMAACGNPSDVVAQVVQGVAIGRGLMFRMNRGHGAVSCLRFQHELRPHTLN